MFKIRYSYFKYQMILFRVFNTLASFQNYITKILVEKLNNFVIIYLNDIFIYIQKLDKSYIKDKFETSYGNINFLSI